MTTPHQLPDPEAIASYVDAAALILGLPIPAEYRDEVIANFSRTAAIAQLVLEFPLPDEVEAATIFTP